MEIKLYGHGIELQNCEVTITGYNAESKTGTALVNGNTIHADIVTNYPLTPDYEFIKNIPYIADVKYSNSTLTYSITLKYVKNPVTEIDDKKSHPSWGVACLSNCQSGREKLFGAMAYHGNHYTLDIKPALIYTNSKFDNIPYTSNAGLPIISIAFTREQLMNLLLGMNNGNGATACTIEYTKEHGYIKYMREDYGSLEAEMRRISKKWQDDNEVVKQCTTNITRLLSEKQTKAIKEEYETWVEKLNGFINGTMLYNVEQLFEHIEKLAQEKEINTVKEPSNKVELIRDLRNATGCMLREALVALKATNFNYDNALKMLKERNN